MNARTVNSSTTDVELSIWGAMNAKASFQARWMPNRHLNRCFECVKPFLEVLMLNVLKHSSLE